MVRKPAEKSLKGLSHEMDLACEDLHGHSIGNPFKGSPLDRPNLVSLFLAICYFDLEF